MLHSLLQDGSELRREKVNPFGVGESLPGLRQSNRLPQRRELGLVIYWVIGEIKCWRCEVEDHVGVIVRHDGLVVEVLLGSVSYASPNRLQANLERELVGNRSSRSVHESRDELLEKKLDPLRSQIL